MYMSDSNSNLCARKPQNGKPKTKTNRKERKPAKSRNSKQQNSKPKHQITKKERKNMQNPPTHLPPYPAIPPYITHPHPHPTLYRPSLNSPHILITLSTCPSVKPS